MANREGAETIKVVRPYSALMPMARMTSPSLACSTRANAARASGVSPPGSAPNEFVPVARLLSCEDLGDLAVHAIDDRRRRPVPQYLPTP